MNPGTPPHCVYEYSHPQSDLGACDSKVPARPIAPNASPRVPPLNLSNSQYAGSTSQAGVTWLAPPATAERLVLGDGTSPLASVSGCPRTYADLTINPGVLTNRASFDPRGDYIDHVDSQSAILERLSFSDYFNDEAWVGSGGDSVHGIQAHLASPMSVDSALNLESPVSDEGLFVQCGVVAGVQEAEAATRSSDSSPGSQSESQVTSNFVKKRPSGSLDSVFKAADLLTQTSPKKRRVAKERPRAPPPSPTLAGCEGQRQATPENNFPSPSPPGSPLTPGSTPTPLSDPESEYFPDPPFTRTRSASRRLARVSSTPELQPVSPALPFRAGDRRMSQNRSAQKKYRDKNRRLLDLRTEYNCDADALVDMVRMGSLTPQAAMSRLTKLSDEFGRNLKHTCAMTWTRYDDSVKARLS